MDFSSDSLDASNSSGLSTRHDPSAESNAFLNADFSAFDLSSLEPSQNSTVTSSEQTNMPMDIFNPPNNQDTQGSNGSQSQMPFSGPSIGDPFSPADMNVAAHAQVQALSALAAASAATVGGNLLGNGHNGGTDAATEMLKGQLAKQLHLQRLQQMQTQLLQQQIEVLSGGNMSFNSSQLDPRVLLTPGMLYTPPSEPNNLYSGLNSIHFRQGGSADGSQSRDLVSPMMLQSAAQGFYPSPSDTLNSYYPLVSPAMSPVPNFHQSHAHLGQPMTAPANLVFSNSSSSTPGLDFLSPLTSPALGPVPYSQHSLSEYPRPSSQFPPTPESFTSRQQQSQPGRSTMKRRSSVDDSSIARKRQSPIIFANNNPGRKGAADSRAIAPASRSRRSSKAMPTPQMSSNSQEANDSPSPVDLSMPPPAARTLPSTASQSTVSPASAFAPITPSLIMNLRPVVQIPNQFGEQTDMNLSLSGANSMLDASYVNSSNELQEVLANAPNDLPPLPPPLSSAVSTPLISAIPPASAKSTPSKDKTAASTSKTRAKQSAASQSNVSAKGKTKATGGASTPRLISSNEGVPQNASQSSTFKSKPDSPVTDESPAIHPQVKKVSHRDAEQKRRDSLKAGFDDLRLLLPPITIDPDGDSNEPPIPGSNPPRGPARNVPGVEDHPNRGVSKLALLRSSNEYIVKLKRRVSRRDDMMEKMRKELQALRLELGISGEDKVRGELELVNLDGDVDAIEKDGDEEKDGKAAARPTELAAKKKAEREAAAAEAAEAGNAPAAPMPPLSSSSSGG